MKIEKKYLEIMFESINGLILEPCIKITKDGFFISSFTPCNSSHCLIEFPKNIFKNFDIENDVKFKIQADILLRIIKRLKNGIITLRIDENKLIISDETNKEYSVVLLIDEDVEKEVPSVEFISEIEINTEKFKDIILDASVVSDIICIETKEKELIINGGELNTFSHKIDVNKTNSAKSWYSIEYITKFMNISKYFENFIFEFSTDSPCRFTFNGDFKIQFLLAARAE